MSAPAITAACVLAGPAAALLRGPSGSGKSRLALAILDDPRPFAFARLVGDDGVHVVARHGRLVASPAPAIAGRIEMRGLGLLTMAFEPAARVALIVDLVAPNEAPRLPLAADAAAEIAGVTLPRLALPARGPGNDRIVLAALAHLARGGGLDAFWR